MKLVQLAVASLLLTTLFLTGCESQPTKTEQPEQLVFTLEDTDWQLESFMQGSAKASGKATLKLLSDKNRIAGSAGCNRYFGGYKTSGDQVSFSQMGATKILCQDMSEEDHFFKYIMRVNRFQIEGNQLILFKDSKPLMQFKATSEPKKKAVKTSVKIEGTVTYFERRLLTGNLTLKVALEDVSRMDVAAEQIAYFEKPITSQIPLKFQLNYDPKTLKPGHRYNLRARIENADIGKLEWVTTEAYPFIPDMADKIELRVKPIVKAQKMASNQQQYQCGEDKVKVLVIGNSAIKLTRGNQKWILKQARTASGSKYENNQMSFWMKGNEAMLEENGEKGISCQRIMPQSKSSMK